MLKTIQHNRRPAPDTEAVEEFDVDLLPDGQVLFSWNSPLIQEIGELLGAPEFDPPRWCG
jgi:hypothetical protein